MIRKARAQWRGAGRDGIGALSTDSGVLENTPYSFRTRFENERGTNPEELIAAAHAGCFSTRSALTLEARVPEIEATKFEELARTAKETCPISRLLNAEVTLETRLIQ
jgi:osmotically inducible protein OsmC